MLKRIKICFLVSFILAVMGIAFASTHIIGTGTATQYNVPFYGYNDYGWCKVLYTADEIAGAGITETGFINSISYNTSNSPNNYTVTNQSIYMYHSHATSPGMAIVTDPDEETLVFRGTIVYHGSGWQEIILDTPFLYNGYSGIEMIYANSHGASQMNYPVFRSTNIESRVFYYPEGEEPHFGYICRTYNMRPNLKLEFASLAAGPQLQVEPLALDFGVINFGETSASLTINISNQGNGVLELSADDLTFSGANADLFAFDDSDFPLSLEMRDEADVSVYLVGNTEGNVSANLDVSYGDDVVSVALSATVSAGGTSIVELGSGTSSQRQPFGVQYGYERSVAVYKATEIGTSGMIESISWYVANASDTAVPYKIYLGSSPSPTYAGLSSYYAEVIEDMSLVHEGNHTFDSTGWHTFEFDEPFIFAGGNLVVAVESNFGGNGTTSRPQFRYSTAASSHRHWQAHNRPPTGISNDGNSQRPNIRLLFSYNADEAVIVLTPDNHDFGTVTFGIDSEPLNLSISNLGGITLNIDESSIAFSGEHAEMFHYDADILPFSITSGRTAILPIHVNSTIEGEISTTITITASGVSAETTLNAFITAEGEFEVEIGDGINANNSSSGATPYMGYYRNYRMQNLIRASEIIAGGGVPGNIDAISYHVQSVNNYAPMPNLRIRLMHTTQETLHSIFATAGAQEVFQSDDYMPIQGWSTHTFDTPFLWDGFSNIIVEIITDMAAGSTQNSSVYYNNPGYSCSTIFSSSSQSANSSTSGNVANNRPNMRLSMSLSGMLDMAAQSITGPRLPNIDTESFYRVTVRNLSSQSIDDYTVKIMKADGTELASAPGTAIDSMEMLEVVVPWTPAQLGTMQIYGKAELAGDEYAGNDSSPTMSVEVIPAGLAIYQFGFGGGTNGDAGWPTPYGTRHKAFREQHLLKASELIDLGGTPGLIHEIAYRVATLNNCGTMQNYRIRLKHTTLETLSTTFEVGEYTEVFQANTYIPTTGWNEHTFSEPFFWNGEDNLLIDIVTDLIDASTTYNASVSCSTTPFDSVLRFYSNVADGTTATTGLLDGFRPNVRVKMLRQEFGSVSGTVMEGTYPVSNATVGVQNTVFAATTNAEGYYHIPFAPIGTHNIVASKHGYDSVSHTIEIQQHQAYEVDFELVGTPMLSINPDAHDFGEVELGVSISKDFVISNAGGSELVIQAITLEGNDAFTLESLPTLPLHLRNEESGSFEVSFMPTRNGEVSAIVTILDNTGRSHRMSLGRDRESTDIVLTGTGIDEITLGEGTNTGPYPFNFGYRSSVSQTIFTNNDLSAFEGQITALKLYNDFETNIPSQHVKIYMGRTTQSGLQTGWIPANSMELVYDAALDFPSGENTIEIELIQPFHFYDGGNLVLLFHRMIDAVDYTGANMFKISTWGTSRSRITSSDYVIYNLSDMSGGTLSGNFPQITFTVIPGGAGHIAGVVKNEEGTPLDGVSVSLDTRRTTQTDQDGAFEFRTLLPGDYQLSFSRHAYLNHSVEVSVDEYEELELDITMTEMPRSVVSGSIIAGDSGEGIEGARIYFFGYQDFDATSEADGSFALSPGVYSGYSYDYVVSAQGYNPVSGSIEVGDADYSMGSISMQEIAYAPVQVAAEISSNHSFVSIAWQAPEPGSFEINESFEGDLFPPVGWTQTITHTGAANNYGVYPTWSRFTNAEETAPSDGTHQAGLVWIEQHQDEWLYTPDFSCPEAGYLRFDTYLHMGSDGGDHYFVKISTNDGASWQVLWDGATQPQSLNNYSQPITIDLSAYAGQMVKLAWHANDGIDQMGMWNNWYIDNVYIGNAEDDRVMSPTLSTGAHDSKALSRALTGYKVWRMHAGQQDAENNWVLLNTETQTDTVIEDPAWAELAQGDYLWAVKAIYTGDASSPPAFSNTLTKENINGTVSGFVRNSVNNDPIAGATVSAGEGYDVTTTASGFYNITLPLGTYSITASHDDYTQLTHENIAVIPGENTTLNFSLEPDSNADVVEIVATSLRANYPNPFNPETTIIYDLKEPAKVRLDVFNLRGQLVKTIVNDQQTSGRYQVVFTARDDRGNKLSSGLYFYRLRAGDYVKTRKMMLME